MFQPTFLTFREEWGKDEDSFETQLRGRICWIVLKASQRKWNIPT